MTSDLSNFGNQDPNSNGIEIVVESLSIMKLSFTYLVSDEHGARNPGCFRTMEVSSCSK